MKRLSFLLVVAILAMYSCKKDVPQTPVSNNTVELEFSIDQADFPSLKNSDTDSVPECIDLPMNYVEFDFGGVTYFSDIFVTMDGKILTKAVKINLDQAAMQTVTLTKFLVYTDVLPVGPGPEDVLVRAAPEMGSLYWDLMENKLDIDVEVEAFIKKEVVVDVLCFEDLYYQNFGFTWFELNKVKIERQCWFGDICTGKLADYTNSAYEGQVNGLQMDMPAIAKIEVFKEGNLIRTFDNTPWLGEGQCMEVYWANDEDLPELFRFDLYVWLPVGANFDWVLIDVFEFYDDDCPDPGTDGVNDFVLGACQMPDADLVYPAWMNLPAQLTMHVGGAFGPGSYGLYIDVDLQGFGGDYDIAEGWQGAFCGNEVTHISLNHTYTVDVVSSLQPLPAGFQLTADKVHKLNYMFNHIPQVIAGYNYAAPGLDWEAVQDAIWNITNGKVVSGTAATLVANAAGHASWNVYPGNWAAVYFNAGTTVQPLFIIVDP